MTGKRIRMVKDGSMIYVFGSNLAGRHGAGSALFARNCYGAVYGVGEGLTGQSYALATKDAQLKTLGIDEIELKVKQFFAFARSKPGLQFMVSNFGTGLTGYRSDEILGLIVRNEKPNNVHLSGLWRQAVDYDVNHVYLASSNKDRGHLKQIKSISDYLDSLKCSVDKTVLVWGANDRLANHYADLVRKRSIRGVGFEENKSRFKSQAQHCAVLSACWYSSVVAVLSLQNCVQVSKVRTVATQLSVPLVQLNAC